MAEENEKKVPIHTLMVPDGIEYKPALFWSYLRFCKMPDGTSAYDYIKALEKRIEDLEAIVNTL